VALGGPEGVTVTPGAERTDTVTAAAPVERNRLAIRDLPLAERPRERLLHYGAEALSTSELLAILLRTGTPSESALGLAERIVATFGGLREVATATIAQFGKVKGVGPVKAVEIKAAIELGKRLHALSPETRPAIRTPADVASLVMSELRHETREHLKAILLDTKNQVLRIVTVSVGSLNESIVHPRELFHEAIRHSAAAVIVVHNHPSGDPAPSAEDIAVTRRLREAGQILGIELLDHVVLGDGRWVSLKEQGAF
jgi:DNA repair protein RadC